MNFTAAARGKIRDDERNGLRMLVLQQFHQRLVIEMPQEAKRRQRTPVVALWGGANCRGEFLADGPFLVLFHAAQANQLGGERLNLAGFEPRQKFFGFVGGQAC